jgi:hypothetical protein
MNWRNQSTGVLAFVTFFLAWAGTIARTGTVLFESDDKLYQAQFLLSVILNSVIMLQFGLYWNEKPKGKARISGPGAKQARNTKAKVE